MDNLEVLISILSQLKSALALLDTTSAPADVGAHLDLTINKLEAFIEQASGDSPLS